MAPLHVCYKRIFLGLAASECGPDPFDSQERWGAIPNLSFHEPASKLHLPEVTFFRASAAPELKRLCLLSYEDDSVGFNSWQDFQNFEREVKYENRFVHSEAVSEFLSDIKRTLPSRERSIDSGSILYRGQIGYEEYESEGQLIISGFPATRMKPTPHKGKEGRANPKGISYLYLSNDENTALAELRPHLGQYLSSAQFQIQRNLRVVDCYSVQRHYSHIHCIFEPPVSQEEIGNAVWSMINEAFTKPVTNADEASDYVPTQILAEFFKSEGFDGICFRSSLGKGFNFILFNLADAELINCTVKETRSVDYLFDECANRYYVQKKS